MCYNKNIRGDPMTKIKPEYESLNRSCFEQSEKVVDKPTDNGSIFFKIDNNCSLESMKEFFVNCFHLKNPELFFTKMKEAVTGSGHPEKDLNNLKSSALCALLFFYSVSDKNPLIIDEILYNKSFFEVKNKAINYNAPSNMDVVLMGKNKDNQNVILFLECKFSEYITNSIQYVPSKYGDNSLSKKIYEYLNVKDFRNQDGEFPFKQNAYSQGIKQVISHLVGIDNFANDGDNRRHYYDYYDEKNINDERKNLYEEYRTYNRVFFKEVLFELDGFNVRLEEYKNWWRKHKKAVEEMTQNKIINFEFKELTTYQDILKENADYRNNLSQKIKEFYNYE